MTHLRQWLSYVIHMIRPRKPAPPPARPERIAADDQYWTPEMGVTIGGKPSHRPLNHKERKMVAAQRVRQQRAFAKRMAARYHNERRDGPVRHAPVLREPLWGRIVHTPWRILSRIGWLIILRKAFNR